MHPPVSGVCVREREGGCVCEGCVCEGVCDKLIIRNVELKQPCGVKGSLDRNNVLIPCQTYK